MCRRSKLVVFLTVVLALVWSMGFSESITIPVEFPEDVAVTTDAAGDHVTLAGCQLSGGVGTPALPVKEFCALLPANIDWSTVAVSLDNAVWNDVTGTFDIAPVPPPATWVDGKFIVNVGENIVNGRDITIYQKDAILPAASLGAPVPSQYREWSLGYVSIQPVMYNPVKKSLQKLNSATITVNFATNGGVASNAIAAAKNSETFWQELAPTLVNPGDRAKFYPAPKIEGPAPSTGPGNTYVIITTSNIQSSSTKLSNFVTHKQSLGFAVDVITEGSTETDSTYITGGSCSARADNIRTWLKNHYSSWGIVYVLLIGDPTPTGSLTNLSIPMKLCYPNYLNHIFGGSATVRGDVPTDLFFCELSGNWDNDGDTFPGEFGDPNTWQDFADISSPGGIDRNYEVHVGRIPYYGTISDLDNILRKTIDYETDTSSVAWRKKVLIPSAVSNFDPQDNSPYGSIDISAGTLGADWGEAIKTLASGISYTPFTLYEKAGIYPGNGFPTTACSSPLTLPNIASAWQNYYGFVTWWGHGNATQAVRIVWLNDLFMPDTYAQYGSSETTSYLMWDSASCASTPLPNDHPSFVVQVSCSNGWPETTTNLGYSLLKDGAIGTFSASRVSWYVVGPWFTTRGPQIGDNASYGYYIFNYMAQNKSTAGKALTTCKTTGVFGTQWGATAIGGSCSWWNMLDFNLYGDPSANQIVQPCVTAVAVQDSQHVDVTFSKAMGTGVTTASNYTISGPGKGDLAPNPNSVAPQGGTTYRLTWTSGEMLNGGDIMFTVATTVQCGEGSLMRSPNSGSIGTPPVTAATGPTSDVGTPVVSVTYSASDPGSGVNYVELYYNKDSAGYTKYGSTFASSPISFDTGSTGGTGTYELYTIGTDNVGNVESAPGTPDVTFTRTTTGITDWKEF